jgi:hypothetical protein
MHPINLLHGNVPYFYSVQVPGDFTCQVESAATQWVKDVIKMLSKI